MLAPTQVVLAAVDPTNLLVGVLILIVLARLGVSRPMSEVQTFLRLQSVGNKVAGKTSGKSGSATTVLTGSGRSREVGIMNNGD